MPYCTQCGTELPPDASYCPRCGAPIVASAPPLEPTIPQVVTPLSNRLSKLHSKIE